MGPEELVRLNNDCHKRYHDDTWSGGKSVDSNVSFEQRNHDVTYGNGIRLEFAEDLSGVTSYTWDADGNQLMTEEPSGEITTHVWDGENRLDEVHHPSGDVVTYACNGDGLRVHQDDGVEEVGYVHDGNNVLLKTVGVGTVEAESTCTPQAFVQVISQLRSGDSSFSMWPSLLRVMSPVSRM